MTRLPGIISYALKMRKARAIIVGVLAAIIVAVVVTSAVRPHEPVYENKRLSEWIAELDVAGRKRAHAVTALREIGTNAVPYLMQTLGPGDSPRKMKLIKLSRQQTLVKLPFRTGYERQEMVLKAFYREPNCGDAKTVGVTGGRRQSRSRSGREGSQENRP
jgi:hypothetical protein